MSVTHVCLASVVLLSCGDILAFFFAYAAHFDNYSYVQTDVVFVQSMSVS